MITPKQLPTLSLLILGFASVCFSQISPFLTPFTGDTITAGTTYKITWTVILGSFVNIQIKNQYSAISTYFNGSNCPGSLSDFGCSQIATDITNLGIYSWAVPANAPSSGFYTLDLSVSNGGLSGSTHYTTGEFFISQPGSGGTNTGPDVTGVGYVTTDSSSSVSATSSVTRRVVTPVATTSVGTTGTATGTKTATSASDKDPRNPAQLGVGIIAGLVVGIILVLIAIGALVVFFARRKKKVVKPVSNPSASGRVRDDGESMAGTTDVDELSYKEGFVEEERIGGRLRYTEDDIPSGRLQHH